MRRSAERLRRLLRTSQGSWGIGAAVVSGVVVLLAVVVVGAWLRMVPSRLAFPHELEWMEGGVLAHVARVLQGKPIYAEPAVEFMAFVYAPLYYYVAALVAHVVGFGLLPLRLVSLLSALACAGLVGLLVRAETRERLFATLAGLTFLATFELSGGWFELARVDSLALALTLAALLAGRHARGAGGFAVAGLLTALACLTKQTALVVAPVLVLHAVLTLRWRGVIAYVATLGAVVGAVTLYHQLSSNGWYWYYTVELPSTHGTKMREYLVRDFWRVEMAQQAPIMATGALLFLSGAPLLARSRHAWFCGGAALSLVLGAYASRLHMGSYLNDLMPAHAALCWLFGLSLHGISHAAACGVARYRAHIAACALAAVQLWLLGGNWSRFAPGRAGRAAGQVVLDRVGAGGEVLVVNHPHFALLAGMPSHAHQMAMIDVFEADSDPRDVRTLLRRKWQAAFEQQRFAQVILDDDWYAFAPELSRHYRRVADLAIPKGALTPRTGTPLAPTQVWVPRSTLR